MSLEILTQSQVFTAPITAKDLFVENIQSLSATINVIDITTYEVSGFNVDGELSATSIKTTDLYVDNIDGGTIGGNLSGYFVSLSADTLGKALNLNSHSLTNANIDSGTIDSTEIGTTVATVGSFTTLSADTLGKELNLDNHSLINANIDSGTIDNTEIGVTTAVQSRFTTLSADTLGKALNLNSHALTNANIDSGTINNTEIGTSTPTIGGFTTLSADTLGKELNLDNHSLINANIDSGTIDNTTINIIASNTVSSRSLQNRFADIVNVKDFGAIGNATADDTTAIQAAIHKAESVGGGVVYFPQGGYKITNTVVLSSPTYGVKLKGTSAQFGSYIFTPNVSGVMIRVESDQTTIEDLTIFRNVMCSCSATGYNIWLRGAVQCKIQDCKIQGGNRPLVISDNATDNLFLRNTFTFSTGPEMVWVVDSGAIHFIACTFNQQYPLDSTIGTPIPEQYRGARGNSTTYNAGDIVNYSNYNFRCSVGGTTDSTVPTSLTTLTSWYFQDITDGTATWRLMGRVDYSGIKFDTGCNYCTIRQCDFTGPYLNAVNIWDSQNLGLSAYPLAINVENCTAHGPIVNGLNIQDAKEIYVNDFNTFNATSSSSNPTGIVIGGDTRSVQIFGCQSYGYKFGINLASTGTVGTTAAAIIANNICTTDTSIYGAGSVGINIANNVTNFIVTGNYVGLGSRGTNWTGIKVGTGCTDYIVTNNLTKGAITGITDSGSAPKSVTSNIP